MRKILYLHGLDSYLHADREEVLAPYGEILAPVFDYKNSPELFTHLCEEYQNIDVIIGSSAGGLIGYFLAQKLQKPCALFNPALNYEHEMPFAPFWDKQYKEYMLLVIGMQDEVIPYKESLPIALTDKAPEQQVDIHLIQNMAHSYPIEIFSQELKFFFDRVCRGELQFAL